MRTANILKNGEAFSGNRKKLSTGEDFFPPACCDVIMAEAYCIRGCPAPGQPL